MRKMSPAEMLERIESMKATGRSCIDLEKAYKNEKIKSRIAFERAKKVFGKLDEMMESGEYTNIMSMIRFSERYNSREQLRKKFSDMMFFYEKINPSWLKTYNEIEDEKTGNMSANIDEENFSMQNLIDEAFSLPENPYGTISPEEMRNVRISALTMFYANKIAHQSQYLRETYLSYYLNYSVEGNDTLNSSLKDGKFKEISNKFKEFYRCKMEYIDEKGRRSNA